MIKVTNLSKVFRTEEIETTALNEVSFEINKGEFVAIMGPSGCGKSTLLNILGLLDNPTAGSYELLGQEVANLKERERTKFRKGNLGFVFQSFNLIDELNVCGTASEISQHRCGRTQTACYGDSEKNEHQPPFTPLSTAVVRRSATACSYSPCRSVKP